MEQSKRAKIFYRELGEKGLSENINEQRTQATLSYCEHFLGNLHDVLDLACGYGRITIPLAKKGYVMKGLDIEPSLLDSARRYANEAGVTIPFSAGDMRHIPFADNSFDAVLCLWAAFNELTEQSDQIRCLQEVVRILRPGGRAVFEMINGERQEIQHELVLFGTGNDGRVLQSPIEGTSLPINHYIHSQQTLRELASQSGIADSITDVKATVEPLGDRKRLFLTLTKHT